MAFESGKFPLLAIGQPQQMERTDLNSVYYTLKVTCLQIIEFEINADFLLLGKNNFFIKNTPIWQPL